jgi:hypothetical protein
LADKYPVERRLDSITDDSIIEDAKKVLHYLLRDSPYGQRITIVPRRKRQYLARRSRRAMRRRAIWGLGSVDMLTDSD